MRGFTGDKLCSNSELSIDKNIDVYGSAGNTARFVVDNDNANLFIYGIEDISSETKNDEKIEEQTAENNENKLKTVDELLKEAENREKALKDEAVKEPEEVKVETEELKPKTTRKRTSTKTEGVEKATPKKRTVKKQTEKDTEKNDKIEE